jgi:hypothetical protein
MTHTFAPTACAPNTARSSTPSLAEQQTRDAFRTHVADVDRLLALQERSIEDRRAATEQCRFSCQALREAATLVINVGKLVPLDDIVMVRFETVRAVEAVRGRVEDRARVADDD